MGARSAPAAQPASALEHNIDVIVRVGTALQWATLAIGQEPQTEEAVDILRVLLSAPRATAG